MKYQQVSVDLVNMVYTAISYLALAGAVWVFLRLLQACFWLPNHLKKQNNLQQMLQDKVDSYEKYILECEEKEKLAAEQGETCESVEEKEDEDTENKKKTPIDEAKWKERRECLEMLKKELKRVQDGGDMYDWDYLLEEDEKENGETKGDDKKENLNSNVDGQKKNLNVIDSKNDLNEKCDDPTEKLTIEELKKEK